MSMKKFRGKFLLNSEWPNHRENTLTETFREHLNIKRYNEFI